jgi:hypothetical protein
MMKATPASLGEEIEASSFGNKSGASINGSLHSLFGRLPTYHNV